jgi:hypothetical protein
MFKVFNALFTDSGKRVERIMSLPKAPFKELFLVPKVSSSRMALAASFSFNV